MVKSIGNKKIKTAVFISGKGTNLRNLIKFSKLKKSPIKICLVFSSNRLAKGLNYAKKYLIKMKIYNFTNKKKAEFLILKDLKKNRIDLICLAGFMKILSPDFIKKFKGKILNIHPSLLPKYKGLNTHARAIKNKDKYSGCTVHLVNAKLDSGKIILQKKIKIFKKDTVYKLKKRVQKQEYKLYPKAISKLFFNL
ncbi:phosphoribosylglycinamide formyltransferase [Candidatus Pelagibacter sp.]|jgi:phosphoribosylglycinamide formyltransferase-1|nr:phosphoribosylglycinamide formyltransferase [Candidatus Pelagibacter sp.]|tara:strand:+ start:999 stop:1583 length:585 start_codon:yes stop_codon:yes gene_type:complete